LIERRSKEIVQAEVIVPVCDAVDNVEYRELAFLARSDKSFGFKIAVPALSRPQALFYGAFDRYMELYLH
jgi:hypothetical protein